MIKEKEEYCYRLRSNFLRAVAGAKFLGKRKKVRKNEKRESEK